MTELSELIVSLNAEVKGKGKQSDPTLEQSATAAGGGNSGNQPPPPQQAAQEHPEVGIAMMTMRTKDGEKEDGMRDQQGRIKHGRTMRMGKRRPLGTRYGFVTGVQTCALPILKLEVLSTWIGRI